MNLKGGGIYHQKDFDKLPEDSKKNNGAPSNLIQNLKKEGISIYYSSILSIKTYTIKSILFQYCIIIPLNSEKRIGF